MKVEDPIRVVVVGAQGRMGTAICSAIEASAIATLSAGVGSSEQFEAALTPDVDVIVDVTNAEAARVNLPIAAERGIQVVVGTTGFDDDDIARFDEMFKATDTTCFVVPNFSIGAVLLMEFSARAAKYFDGVEVIELHHNQKKDAPSGTATLTTRKIADARAESDAGDWTADPTERETAQGARGGVVDGIHVHSIRLPGLLAHEEVIFGSQGQILTLRHDSFDRAAFMPGVLLAVEKVSGLDSGVTFGLESVLGDE